MLPPAPKNKEIKQEYLAKFPRENIWNKVIILSPDLKFQVDPQSVILGRQKKSYLVHLWFWHYYNSSLSLPIVYN